MTQQYPEQIDLIHSLTPSSSFGGLFLGNIEAARNISTLQKLKIKAVVTVAKGGFLLHKQNQLPNYLYIPAEDTHSFNLSAYFSQTYEFIDRNIGRTNVFVHCQAGVSRSATVVIAFLMRKYSMEYGRAYEVVKKQRHTIRPNQGFALQLKFYESILKNSQNQSASRVSSPPRTTRSYSVKHSSAKHLSSFDSLPDKQNHTEQTSCKQSQICAKLNIVTTRSNSCFHTSHLQLEKSKKAILSITNAHPHPQPDVKSQEKINSTNNNQHVPAPDQIELKLKKLREHCALICKSKRTSRVSPYSRQFRERVNSLNKKEEHEMKNISNASTLVDNSSLVTIDSQDLKRLVDKKMAGLH